MNIFSCVVEWVMMKPSVENYFLPLHLNFAALKGEYR
jgi:hypothetical protein